MEQDEIIIDGSLLTRALRRQAGGWLWKGPLLFGALLLAALALVPRSYTASVSVAMQQPTSPGGLAGLLGAGGGNKHYLGVLKSRKIAAQVENRVHLQQVYGSRALPTEGAAVTRLAQGVKPEDNLDGLLYISVTLPGPPRLGLGHSPQPKQIEDAAAQAANAYAAALKNYFITSNDDEGSALLHGADTQVRHAKADYNQALGRLRDFSRAAARQNPRSAGTSPRSSTLAGEDSDAATAASGLATLTDQYDRVQTDLHAAQAARLARESGTNEQLRNLSRLPTSDPQLSDIRTRVASDQIVFNTDSNLYGPENAAVITARERLKSDQQQLDLQTQGVQERLTTLDINSNQQINSLFARQATLSDKIAQAERRLGISRNLSFELDRLKAEVGFQSDILRATLTTAQSIRLNNASAQSRMTIIDSALAPGAGEPGTARLALLCLLPVLLAFLGAVVLDYLRGARTIRIGDKTGGDKAAGTGGTPLSAPTNGSSTRLTTGKETRGDPDPLSPAGKRQP